MPERDKNILKYNHEQKSTKVPFIIYADIKSLLEKIDTCHSNPKKSSITKINQQTSCCYSLLTRCSFDNTKNKHNYYGSMDYRKNFSKSLKKCATEIINHNERNNSIIKQRE